MLKIVIGALMVMVGLITFVRMISDEWREVLRYLIVIGAIVLAAGGFYLLGIR